ncbi:DUF4097 family beta strand repeat-containing protein [Winogradskyella ursingii]|uniref:hypothetical protein n=1 Tax=Winogradskyella ursingii TaxID=2686079 RepID=UPI0015C8C826|nr:hypothetical protein [Winogradskyella ursingii]
MINNNIFIGLTRPFRFLKPERSFYLLVFFLGFQFITQAQNKSHETINADGIFNIEINGNDIFKIKIETSESENIVIKSLNDGEYQNHYAISTKIILGQLNISLNQLPFTTIADDKRNAHKVVAASLSVIIPKDLNVSISSDIASVEAIGDFKNLVVELKSGSCSVDGTADFGTIHSFDGDIIIKTRKADINAKSNNGIISIAQFDVANSFWKLQSINGNITVTKQD